MRSVPILALVLLTLVAFWPVQHNGFILFDDEDYITGNKVVAQGLTGQGIALAFTRSYAGNWFPLTWISHMVDVELFGLAPRGHHLAGLAIHLATALLLLLALRAMTGRAGPAFLVAALFAVHPLHVESVAWAAERKDVLSAFFWMLTTALYLRYVRRPSPARYLPALLCFALGLMAKQMLVTLPLVLLLLDWWPLGRLPVAVAAGSAANRPRLFVLVGEKVPLLVLAAFAGLFALEAQSSAGLVHSLRTFPLAARVANAILAPVRYLAKTLWPVDLAIFYPYTSHAFFDAPIVLAGALLIAASAAALLLRRRHPWLLVGWAWYLVTLLPVLGLIQVGDQALADRYTYLPLVGIFISFGWALAGARRSPRLPGWSFGAGTVVVALVLLLLAGLTREQVARWRDDDTLFRHALRVTRDNWLASYFVGVSLEQSGDRQAAESFLRDSIRIKPDYGNSRVGLARLLRKRGQPAAALAELRAAVAADPRSHRLRLTLVRALRAEGLTAEALDALRAAVAALPENHELRMTLALTLADSELTEEAIAHFREMLRLWPNAPESYNNLAALLARRGQVEEAEGLLRRALEIDPAYPDARLNLEALAGPPHGAK